MKITPKNWDEFQHYKDRRPAWIKLHRSMLDNYDFHMLPVASKALAPFLWLLASEYDDGCIDASPKEIAFRVRMTESDLMEALNPLIESVFFNVEHCASEVLAECLPREEKRRDREEKEKRVSASKVSSVSIADLQALGVQEQVACEFLALRKTKKATLTKLALAGIQKEAELARLPLNEVLHMCVIRGWQGFRADWARSSGVTRSETRLPREFSKTQYEDFGRQ